MQYARKKCFITIFKGEPEMKTVYESANLFHFMGSSWTEMLALNSQMNRREAGTKENEKKTTNKEEEEVSCPHSSQPNVISMALVLLETTKRVGIFKASGDDTSIGGDNLATSIPRVRGSPAPCLKRDMFFSRNMYCSSAKQGKCHSPSGKESDAPSECQVQKIKVKTSLHTFVFVNNAIRYLAINSLIKTSGHPSG